MLDRTKDKNILFELTKAADLICVAYQVDILYDRDVFSEYGENQMYLWCCNDCGTHITTVDITTLGFQEKVILRPKPIFFDSCFSGSARLTAFIKVNEMKGSDKNKIPWGTIIWLSHDKLVNLKNKTQTLEQVLQWELKGMNLQCSAG